MNKVKELIMGAGVSQKALALSIGVSRPTVSDWVNGKRDPTGVNLHRLAEYFGVAWQEIVPDEIAPAGGVARSERPSGLSEMEFALYSETRTMSEEEIADVLDYARFKKAKRGGGESSK